MWSLLLLLLLSFRYLLEILGVAMVSTTCFSNRLLPRLYKAECTVEALAGVAFVWEYVIQQRINDPSFNPSYDFFCQQWLDGSRLDTLVSSGLGIVLYDEEWTLHPLIHDHFVRFLDERHVMSCGAGELLQTRPKLEQQWLDRNWHQPLAFNEPYYQQLLQRGSVLFMRLRHNHRLPPDQFKMMQRVSVEGATCLSIVLNVLSTA